MNKLQSNAGKQSTSDVMLCFTFCVCTHASSCLAKPVPQALR